MKPVDFAGIILALPCLLATANADTGNTEQTLEDTDIEVVLVEGAGYSAEHDGNVSATARALGMYRRTLQRKLAKRPRSE